MGQKIALGFGVGFAPRCHHPGHCAELPVHPLRPCSTGTPGVKGKGRAGGASKGDFLKGKHASWSHTDVSFLITSPELPYKASLPRCTTPPDCPSVSPSCPGCTRPSCTFHPKPQKWKYSWPGSRHGWISGIIMDFQVRGTTCVQ